jgi:hypothetical protein
MEAILSGSSQKSNPKKIALFIVSEWDGILWSWKILR